VSELAQRQPVWTEPVAGNSDAAAAARRLAWPQVFRWELVAVAAACAFLGTWLDDWLAAAVLLVLWVGYKLLVFPGGTPVLLLAFGFEWMQVSLGVLYHDVTGRDLMTIARSDYRPMVLIGLGCVIALAVGLRLGLTLVWRYRAPDEPWPEEAFTWPLLIGVYATMLMSETTVKNFAWDNPSITQAVLTIDMARLGVLFLLFRRLTRPTIRWHFIGLLLLIEIIMGFIGYFAGFREPIILVVLALLEVFDRRRTEHRLALASMLVLGSILGVLWIGIRTDYRRDFTELDTYQTSTQKRIGRIQDLSTNWLQRDNHDLLNDVDFFVERVWAIYYPALAVSRVPSQVPHTNGALLWAVIQHLTMPRVFFPDKPVLPSNSDLVRRYSGVWVAGQEQNTSIAFGYAAESYVDFGVPLMFLPIFVFAIFMGMAYAWLMNHIYHRELAVALTTVIFWLSLYLFERSWAKMAGDALTMLLYLGTVTVLLDRLLLTKFEKQRNQSPVAG
jgi:hypothetical protein